MVAVSVESANDSGAKQAIVTKRYLTMLAPYFAVGIFWCGFSNAWLAILAYHVQILAWTRPPRARMRTPLRKRLLLLALPTALTGPLAYYLLPYITHTDLPAWLAGHHLSRLSLLAMLPYFGLVHPFLEQLHWAPLRAETPLAHFMFAGYHMLVLHSLLSPPWLPAAFIVLVAASFAWQRLRVQSGGLAIPVASHILADAGLVAAVWLRT